MMETKAEAANERVAALLSEYADKVYASVSRIEKNSQEKKSIRLLVVAITSITVVLPLFGPRIMENSGIGPGSASVEWLVLVALCFTFAAFGTYLIYRYVSHFRGGNIERFRAKATSLKLARLVRYADQMVEHRELHPVEKLELSLRIAEAEAILQESERVLNFSIREHQYQEFGDEKRRFA